MNVPGVLNPNGYGRKYHCGKLRLAHRVAFCVATGMAHEDIAGRVVMHTCDNRACVSPEHLRLGTQAENLADMRAKGRQAVARPARQRLTEDQLRAARAEYIPHSRTHGLRSISRRLGVDHKSLHHALAGGTYRNYKD